MAVKKVSDVDVSMFGPELKVSMYKCCFLACFCASQGVQRRKTGLTAQIREKLPNGWADWHQIWHTSADPSGNGYTPNKLPLETQRGHLGEGLVIKHSKVWGGCQTAGPIVTNFGSRQYPRGHGGGVGVGVTNTKVGGSCQTGALIGTEFGTRRRFCPGAFRVF